MTNLDNLEKQFEELDKKILASLPSDTKIIKVDKILVNQIRCNHCGKVITSERGHNCVSCGCDHPCAVDGADGELGRTGKREDWTELSILSCLDENGNEVELPAQELKKLEDKGHYIFW